MQQMKTSLLCVLLLGLGLALAGNSGEHFKPGSGFKPDEQDRFDECQPLVSHDGCKCSGESHSGSHEVVTKEPGSTVSPGSTASPGSTPAASSISPAPGSGEWDEGDYCFLFQAFLNFSIELDVEIKEIFIAWINISQVEIVEDKNLTDYEKIVKIWYSLQILFSEYSEIEVKIKYKHIPFWGFVCNLKDLVIHIQSKTTIVTKEEVIEESGGSCPLTKSLKKCESNLTTSESGEVDILITDIDTISKGKGMFSKKMADIYKKFKAFYGKNPHLKSKISECEIDGFGIVGSYYDISQTYWHIEYFKVAVGGSADDTNCKLLKALYKLYSNTTLDFSMRNDMKELHDKLQVYYAANVSVEFRIQYFAEQLYELLILAQWDIGLLYSAQIEGFDGDCADLILAWVYCEDNDVSSEEFTTVEASTSTTTTTTTSTTTAKPTTTVPQGDCSTVFGVNVFTANITILLSSIDKAQQSWSSGNVTQFSGYKLRIYNYSKNITLTDSQKFNSIKTVFTGFAGSATLKQMVMSIFINGWGTVTQYCACNK